MTYLKPTTCELLHKLGVKCETGMWYDRQNRLVDVCLGSSSYVPGGIGTSDMVEYTPAYSFLFLITDSEAMKAIWTPGDYVIGWNGMMMCDDDGNDVTNYDEIWQYMAHQLLDLCLSGDYEAAEQLLVEALERVNATN